MQPDKPKFEDVDLMKYEERLESVNSGTWHGPIANRADLNELLDYIALLKSYARFLYVCANSGEKPETLEWFIQKQNERN